MNVDLELQSIRRNAGLATATASRFGAAYRVQYI